MKIRVRISLGIVIIFILISVLFVTKTSSPHELKNDQGSVEMVFLYKQDDEKWSNVECGIVDTIGTSGCLISSFSIIVSYLYEKNITPEDVINNNIVDYNCLFNWENAANEYNLTYLGFKNIPRKEMIKIIKKSIDKNVPVIIGQGEGDTTHWVVAYKYDEDNIYIHDSSKNNLKTLLYFEMVWGNMNRVALYKRKNGN